eukprot:TRINITY_DN503_c0_g7_i1.p1 TRINITY_DN503_c0_g7~~TRINITY_DN503_c0_g7_i1.p1  ORF type:complete len:376 (+),score=37.68 TRINITY_DN503_c0_g7_i1:30-1157(+)
MNPLCLICITALASTGIQMPSEYSAGVEEVNFLTGEIRTWHEWRGAGWVVVLEGTTLRAAKESKNGVLWGHTTRHVSGGLAEGDFTTLYSVFIDTWKGQPYQATASKARNRPTLHYPSGIDIFGDDVPVKVTTNNTQYNILTWKSYVDLKTLLSLTEKLAINFVSQPKETLQHSDYSIYAAWFTDGILQGYLTEVAILSAELTAVTRTSPDGSEVTIVFDTYVHVARNCRTSIENNGKKSGSELNYEDLVPNLIRNIVDMPSGVTMRTKEASFSSDWIIKDIAFTGTLWSVSGNHNLSVFRHQWSAESLPSCNLSGSGQTRLSARCSDTCCDLPHDRFSKTAFCSLILIVAMLGISSGSFAFYMTRKKSNTPTST